MKPHLSIRSQQIKTHAQRLGFLSCGIAKADFLSEEALRLEQWLKQDKHGKMGYMENHFDKRLDPRLLVPGAKSVISLLFNYHTDKKPADPQAPKIATYAYGKDYHFVIKDKLKALLALIQDDVGEVNGRVFVDSAPVLEKAWAARSGLGWVGKNTNLITQKVGSYYFIAELILDLDLEYDTPATDHCGTCTACIDACPTEALTPYDLDAQKCISYLTIELREEIPSEFQKKLDGWTFGCDVCQEVCPWNRFSKPHREPLLEPHPNLLSLSKREWHDMTREVFNTLFKDSAVKRTRFDRFKKNMAYSQGE